MLEEPEANEGGGAGEATFVELWDDEKNEVLVDQYLLSVAKLLAGRRDCLASHVEAGTS
ncbi:MAG: hypothetical protein OXI66_01945 [Boseongicola sp.]|nr:hypothetical protein [Boseongicola sp.]MDE0344529.1 hypothetical protein [Boseongicola sp.]